MTVTQETRITEIFGPKLIVETGNQEMGMSGREAFCIKSVTDSGLKFIQSHTESGLTKLKTEGVWFFEAAGHKSLAGQSGLCAFEFLSHRGDISFDAAKGHIKMEAKQIILDASKEIVLQAPRIRIGNADGNSTKEIKIIAQEVDIKSKRGTLADSLMLSSYLKTFDGTLIADLAFSQSPLGIAKKVFGLL
jgi:hypothetical protein